MILHLTYVCESVFGPFENECIQTGIKRAMSAFAWGMVTPGLRRPIPCSPKPPNVCLIAIERERHQEIEVVVDDAETARHDTDNRARAAESMTMVRPMTERSPPKRRCQYP